MKKIAFLFPGQGSQKVGMGRDLYDAQDPVKKIFETADAVSGLPITRLCFEGPMEELTQTVNLQPAITAVNLACLTAITAAHVRPSLCAGHSLGEYSALQAAGVISIPDCLKLVFERGRLMHREALRRQGAMSAIVGLSIDDVNAIVAQSGGDGVVAVANHNSAEQIVITGEPEAVKAAGAAAAQRGGRAVPLNVSGAWHSPLIRDAEPDFRRFLAGVAFHEPACPVLHNVTAAEAEDGEQMKELMAGQLCSPVRWYDTIQKMAAAQTEVFVEIGPGRVLTGLLKKILPKGHPAEIYNVSDLESATRFVEAVS